MDILLVNFPPFPVPAMRNEQRISRWRRSIIVCDDAWMRLGHLGLPVVDLERSLTFYATHFGFDPATATTYPDHTVIVRNADGFDLALHPVSSRAGQPEFLHFGFHLDSADLVHAKRAEITAAGFRIIEEYEDPALVSFKCLDPDGWPVEVYWEP